MMVQASYVLPKPQGSHCDCAWLLCSVCLLRLSETPSRGDHVLLAGVAWHWAGRLAHSSSRYKADKECSPSPSSAHPAPERKAPGFCV